MSCNIVQPKWVTSAEGTQPKRSEFHFSEQVLGWNSLIDTASVYLNVAEWTISGNPEQHRLYTYLRFSNNGTMFMSGQFERQPDINDYNMMAIGDYSLYKVEGDEIKVETYNPLLKRFDVWFGKITPNEINFYEYKGRAWGTSKGRLKQQLFRKIPAQLTSTIKFPD